MERDDLLPSVLNDGGHRGPIAVEEGGHRFVEGSPDLPFVRRAQDATMIVEACWSAKTRDALLYPGNLPNEFFDLSSGQAGLILQKLRNYRIRLAVVCPPGAVRFSSRFDEMVAEEKRANYFRVFESRDEALAWLNLG